MTAVDDYTGPPGHVISIGRWQRGKTPIRPTRPIYGTSASCSCGGWRGRANYAPSKGGRRAVIDDHRAHVAEATAAVTA